MTIQTAFMGPSQFTRPDISKLFPEGIDAERIDSLYAEPLFYSVYLVLLSMCPEGTKVVNLFPSPEFKGPVISLTDSRQVIRSFLGQYPYLAGVDFNVPLPELALCSGIGVQQKEDNTFVSYLNSAYYPETCISIGTNRALPVLRTFLKAFLLGYVRPDFYLRDAYFYQLPQSVTSVTVESHGKTVTSQVEISTQQAAVTLCPCGCGVTLIGRQKAATPACRKRLERQRRVAA